MEERMRKRFTIHVITEAAKSYHLRYEDLVFIGNHQSYVFKAKAGNRTIYLRITHQFHRDKEQIMAELNWINYLSENGVSVACPVESAKGALIESIQVKDSKFYAVAFEEASGKAAGDYQWSYKVVEHLGEETAKMHNISRCYVPEGNSRRFQWDKNNFLVKADEYLPNQWKVIDALDDLIERIRSLEKKKDSYGLIHGDLVACNYHMDGKKVIFFDFDESCYCWYMNDIAIPLFYGCMTYEGKIDIEGAKVGADYFFRGYSKNCHLEENSLKQIPLFLNLREIILYIATIRSQNMSNLGRWAGNFMKNRKEKIENREPFIEIDFSRL